MRATYNVMGVVGSSTDIPFQVADVVENICIDEEVVYRDGYVRTLLVRLPTAVKEKRVQYHHALTKVLNMGRPRIHACTTVLDCPEPVRYICE